MGTIVRAKEKDFSVIVNIGKIAVEEAHRGSCSAEEMKEYLENNYNDEEIQKELRDFNNSYHIIYYNELPAGFSKIILNSTHPDIPRKNVTKLDRIYLLKEFFGLKLGFELLNFNIGFSKINNQAGMWLFTWVDNKRAVNFYLATGFKIIGSHQFKVTETRYNLNHHMFLDFGITSEKNGL